MLHGRLNRACPIVTAMEITPSTSRRTQQRALLLQVSRSLKASVDSMRLSLQVSLGSIVMTVTVAQAPPDGMSIQRVPTAPPTPTLSVVRQWHTPPVQPLDGQETLLRCR